MFGILDDPRYPEWIPVGLLPRLEVWWPSAIVCALLGLAAVVVVYRWSRTRSRRASLALVAATAIAATALGSVVVWATRRYPPPTFEFELERDYEVVAVVIAPSADRRTDSTLVFDESCVALLHPSDLRRFESRRLGYASFPLWIDQSFNYHGAEVLTFPLHPATPHLSSPMRVRALLDACGSDAAREAWGPPSLRLDGGDNFLLVGVPEFIESDASLPPLPEVFDRRSACGMWADVDADTAASLEVHTAGPTPTIARLTSRVLSGQRAYMVLYGDERDLDRSEEMLERCMEELGMDPGAEI